MVRGNTVNVLYSGNRMLVRVQPTEHYNHVVYKITNCLNGKFYIGVHKIIKSDSYMGSGKIIRLALKKYGKENFKKEILASFTNKKSAYLMESALVSEEFLSQKNTYNIRPGGLGGFGAGMDSPWFGRTHTKETKEKISKAMSGSGNPMYGKITTKETKEKISKAMSGSGHPNFGKPISKETKEKISKAMSGSGNPMYGKKGEQHPSFNTIWITNNIENKKIKKDDVIPNGWKRGRSKF